MSGALSSQHCRRWSPAGFTAPRSAEAHVYCWYSTAGPCPSCAIVPWTRVRRVPLLPGPAPSCRGPGFLRPNTLRHGVAGQIGVGGDASNKHNRVFVSSRCLRACVRTRVYHVSSGVHYILASTELRATVHAKAHRRSTAVCCCLLMSCVCVHMPVFHARKPSRAEHRRQGPRWPLRIGRAQAAALYRSRVAFVICKTSQFGFSSSETNAHRLTA